MPNKKASSKPKRQPEAEPDALALGTGPTKVWSSAGANIQIAPFNSVQFSFGFSKTSPSESAEDILATERQVYAACEKIVAKRLRKMARLAEEVRAEYGQTDGTDGY